LSENVRFAVIGMGMGRSRARTVTKTPGAALQVVCDLREERVRPVAEELGCPWTQSLEEVLQRDDVDVVEVMLPSGLHGNIAIQAMRAGKHAITTKPMDISLAKADAMIACAAETGRILAVDFDSRYVRSWHQIKAAIDGGYFGKMVLGEARLKWWRAQSYYSDSGWRGTWALDGGGSLANQTIHFIDLLVWLMGDVEEVLAAHYGAYTHDIETEDLGMAMLRFKNGAMGQVLGTTTFPKSPYAGLEVHGEQGGVLHLGGEPAWHFLDETRHPPEATPPVHNVIEDMVSAIRHGTPVAVDGREGRRSLALLTAIYTSARERRPVLVDR
jgi:predicted dehydrogenase